MPSSTTSSGGALAALPADCEVFEGETTTFDLDLFETGAVVRGQLLVNGELPGAWKARLLEVSDEGAAADLVSPYTRTEHDVVGPDGRFEVRAPRAGRWRLVLEAPTDQGLPLILMREIEVAGGGVDVHLDLAAGQLTLKGLAVPDRSAGEPSVDILTWSDGTWDALVLLASEDGAGRLAVAPAGDLRVVRVAIGTPDWSPTTFAGLPADSKSLTTL